MINWVLNTPLYFEMYRSGRLQTFFKIGVLKHFTIFTGKHLSWRLFFIKVAGLKACNYIKKRLQHRCFPVNIAEFLRIAIFIEHLWWLLECRVITLKQVQIATRAFLRCSFTKTFLNFQSIGRGVSIAESDLTRVAPAALL